VAANVVLPRWRKLTALTHMNPFLTGFEGSLCGEGKGWKGREKHPSAGNKFLAMVPVAAPAQ